VELTNLKDTISELQELVSAEGQLAEPLARMAEVASHPDLKQALTRRSEATLVQKKRVESILHQHHAGPEAHTDQAMQALIAEVRKMLMMLRGNELRDGTTAAFAGQLGLREDQGLLHRSLEEAKRFDEALTRFAKGTLNPYSLA
jgi:ferritin-like metal-binding protein YciE